MICVLCYHAKSITVQTVGCGGFVVEQDLDEELLIYRLGIKISVLVSFVIWFSDGQMA